MVNVPGGRVPTDYPPIAISRIIEGVAPELDCRISFYNLDLLRPTFDQILKRIRADRPQVIGFSAILTPTYKYLKDLSLLLKKEFPEIPQVLGGEMSVIHKLVLTNSAVDFCVIGQAEPAFSALLGALRAGDFSAADKGQFMGIKGLAFINRGEPFFTGEQAETTDAATRQINYELLAEFTDIRQYIHEVGGRYYRDRIAPSEIDGFFSLFQPDNLGRNLATVFTSKGCVGRCSFCHRYFKGYKVINCETLMEYISHISAKHNVGMLLFQVEDFGTDAAATARLTDFLKGSGLNWAAPAVRVKTCSDEKLRAWKEAGCVNVNFGIESCSQKMLDVMEKGVRVEENLNALRLCNKHRLATIISLVIGMPGETEATIEETIANLATVIPDDIGMVYELSINFFQAVPGTAGYEFARHMGLIPSDPKGEEKYIEGLHEAVANEISHYLNFTDYEKEEVLYWKDYIQLELLAAYLRKHGRLKVLRLKKSKRFQYAAVYGLLPHAARKFLFKYYIVLRYYKLKGLLDLLKRKLLHKRPAVYSGIDRSLRLINKDFEAGKPWPTLKN